MISTNYSELSEPLYHGSDIYVTDIDFSKCVPKKDFGLGFYATNDYYQAEKFARLKSNRAKTTIGYVSSFKFRYTDGLMIKKFNSSDSE